ncbi:CBO0543 family protein [Cohnella panacarvi]|uniref:CBO0543 family protein n=1 Tax=Cohnella panacarvi TaxID=400776 RepID=UPI00047DE325|nr:CBO0543 family protein [Cohnella panacarvi]
MGLEQNLLLAIWIFSLLVISAFVPCHKRHSFVIAFITAQGLDWFAQMMFLQYNVLSFPVREFPKASDMSITLMIVLMPLYTAIYVIYEPRATRIVRAVYLVLWTSFATLTDITISRYSGLQDHKSYYWLVAELVFGVILVISNAVVRWFFRHLPLSREDRGNV